MTQNPDQSPEPTQEPEQDPVVPARTLAEDADVEDEITAAPESTNRSFGETGTDADPASYLDE